MSNKWLKLLECGTIDIRINSIVFSYKSNIHKYFYVSKCSKLNSATDGVLNFHTLSDEKRLNSIDTTSITFISA